MCEFVVNRVKVALNDSATLERIKEAALQVGRGVSRSVTRKSR